MMKKKDKLYYYSHETGRFREISGYRLKGVGLLLGALVFALCTILITNHFYYNYLDLGYRRAAFLETENKILSEQVRSFSNRLSGMERTLEEFAARDTELRLNVDLPTIDEDMRRAGVGGSSYDYGIAAGNSRELLNRTHVWLERLERELQLQRESFAEIEKKQEYNETFFNHIPAIKPADGRYNAHGFGRRRHPVLGHMHVHDGLDIACDVGTPVYATADGVVELAGRSNGGYGRMVIINHGYGYKSLYAHLSSTINVKRGQRVKRGDVIALSGRSGLVTGPHLHYEVILNGVKQNPIDYFFDNVDFHAAREDFAEGIQRRR
jgi:murein DD-endopeptidase MepM/ murein hydrolase activator NlpD